LQDQLHAENDEIRDKYDIPTYHLGGIHPIEEIALFRRDEATLPPELTRLLMSVASHAPKIPTFTSKPYDTRPGDIYIDRFEARYVLTPTNAKSTKRMVQDSVASFKK